jgi:lipopolysaccharide biosynthesis glycosyltransferase
VRTARRHTQLEPVCIYDGEENALTAWLAAARVPVIRRSTFLGAITIEFPPIARGAYLRLEVPAICRERGWTDRFVLYTDCDVMFVRDVTPLLDGLAPRFLAAAPEGDRTDLVRFNSGVMLINVPAWEAELPALTDTFRRNMAEALAPPYDQALLQRHFAGRIDPLPNELNWKPYWEQNAAAAILHFHGPKPAQRPLLLNRQGPAELQRLATEQYFHACLQWDAEWLAALEDTPWPDVTTAARVEPGFEGFDQVTGLGVPEGPFPHLLMPVVRWGVAPATRLTFEVPAGQTANFEAIFQCPHTDQVVTVSLDGRELSRTPIQRVSDPTSVRLDLPVGAGRHEIALTYARSYPQSNGDPRALAVLYRALRIRLSALPASMADRSAVAKAPAN